MTTNAYDRLTEIILEGHPPGDLDDLADIIDALPEKTIDPEYNSLRGVVRGLITADAPLDEVLPRIDDLYDRINTVAIEMRYFLDRLDGKNDESDESDNSIDLDPAWTKAIDKLRFGVENDIEWDEEA